MCNLSQGIKEKAFEGGYTEGKQNGYADERDGDRNRTKLRRAETETYH